VDNALLCSGVGPLALKFVRGRIWWLLRIRRGDSGSHSAAVLANLRSV